MNPLTKLAVLLCVLVQAWVGCAGGQGKSLCVSLHWHVGGEAAVESAHGGCGHDHHDHRDGHDHGPLPVPVPAHDHDGDCCIDIPLTDLGGLRRMVSIEPCDDFAGPWMPIGLEMVFTDLRFATEQRRIGRGPPDVMRARASMGVMTTRLRL